jgi:hypothetical protein
MEAVGVSDSLVTNHQVMKQKKTVQISTVVKISNAK